MYQIIIDILKAFGALFFIYVMDKFAGERRAS